jgi:hypothetical protein
MGFLSFQLKLDLQNSWHNFSAISNNISLMKAGQYVEACVQIVRMARSSLVRNGSDSSAAEISSVYQII